MKKEMDADEMERAIVEITLNKKPSKLKEDYPEEYEELVKEIRNIQRSGNDVEIPFDIPD
jgi:hypothetical protein